MSLRSLSHFEAKRLVENLELDQDARAALIHYIAAQAAPDDWSNETIAQEAGRASRRAIEAISRVATLNSDLNALSATVGDLSASLEAMATIIAEQQEKIDMLVEIALSK